MEKKVMGVLSVIRCIFACKGGSAKLEKWKKILVAENILETGVIICLDTLHRRPFTNIYKVKQKL